MNKMSLMRLKKLVVGIWLGVLILGLASSSSLLKAQSLEEKPILYLKFDEGEGDILHDSSLSSNIGSIHGGSWIDTDIGKAVFFDGENDYVTFPSPIHGKTIEVLFKTESPKGFLIHNAGRWAPLRAHSRYTISARRGHLHITIGGGRIKGKEFLSFNSKEQVNTGRWVHAVLTLDEENNNISLYINGNLDTKEAFEFTIFDSKYFTIGAEYCKASVYVLEGAEAGIEEYIEAIRMWEEVAGKKFGDPEPIYNRFFPVSLKR